MNIVDEARRADADAPLTLQQPARVLVVEDDEDTALPLVHSLERDGHIVTWVTSGHDALDYLGRHPAELVVLDLGLPDIDGMDLCRRVRGDGYDGRMLIVTARDAELDRVVGLDDGADDYLAKPFALAELRARVRALLRRTRVTPRPEPSAPTEGLHVEEHRVRVDGVDLALGSREYDVLRMLVERRDEVVSRVELIDTVWADGWYGSGKAVDLTIARLRQKLAAAGAADRIVTVRGIGFRLERD